jgi:hypothetical protein
MAPFYIWNGGNFLKNALKKMMLNFTPSRQVVRTRVAGHAEDGKRDIFRRIPEIIIIPRHKQ